MKQESNKMWEALENGVFPNVEGESRQAEPTTPLTLNDYQKRAYSTCMDSCDNWEYLFTGLVAEVGEVADLVAKAVRKKRAFVEENKLGIIEAESEEGDFDKSIKKELGDVLWFLAILCRYLNLPFEEVARANLHKLAERKAKNEIITHTDH